MRILIISLCLIPVFLFVAGGAFPQNHDTRDTGNPFGVLDFLQWRQAWNDYQYPKFEDVQKAVLLMEEAGVKMIRLDMDMVELEPASGEFSFEYCDRIVDLLRDHDIQIRVFRV